MRSRGSLDENLNVLQPISSIRLNQYHSLASAAFCSLAEDTKIIFRKLFHHHTTRNRHYCSTSTTLALLVNHLRLWAGTRSLAIRIIRTIMTTSTDAPAAVAKTSSNSSPDTITHGNGTLSSSSPRQKLHGRLFYESIGSPKFVLAPMVDQSEFVGPRFYDY